MSREDVETHILKPMQASFLPPRADLTPNEIAMALQAYIYTLKAFDSETLDEAWMSVVAAHRGRNWPVPAVIVMAASKAARDKRIAKADAEPKRSIEAERDKYWRACCKSDKALRAAEAGVSWALKLAIIEDGKSLTEVNLQNFVDANASAEKLHARIVANQPLYAHDGRNIGIMQPMLRERALAMYDTVKASEARTRAEILEAHGGA